MSERLTEARKKVLRLLLEAGESGTRPRGANLTTAHWLSSKGYAKRFRPLGKMQSVYSITDAGRAALAVSERDGGRP